MIDRRIIDEAIAILVREIAQKAAQAAAVAAIQGKI